MTPWNSPSGKPPVASNDVACGAEGLGPILDERAANGAPKPADLIDPPDIDSDAVQRTVDSHAKRQARRAKLAAAGKTLIEAPSPTSGNSPDHPLVLGDSRHDLTWLNRREDSLALLTDLEPDYDFVINYIIWGEVLRGRIDPHRHDRYERAFSLTRRLHLNSAGWQRGARLVWKLERRAEVIPLTDIIIGVTALEPGVSVRPFDRHFQKIPGVIAISDLA